jgi:hypothetical protein
MFREQSSFTATLLRCRVSVPIKTGRTNQVVEEGFRGTPEIDSSARGSQAMLIIKLKYSSIGRSLLYKYPNCYYGRGKK